MYFFIDNHIYHSGRARKFKKVQAKKIHFMKNFFDQIPIFAISKMANNQYLNWGKSFKTAKNAISRNKFLIYLIS